MPYLAILPQLGAIPCRCHGTALLLVLAFGGEIVRR